MIAVGRRGAGPVQEGRQTMARRRKATTEPAAAPATDPASGKTRSRMELTPARAKRLIGVGTAVAPLLAPYVITAAAALRERWDAHRARQLGVPADQLGRFTGRGGSLFARISRVAEALTELEAEGNSSAATGAARRFARDTRPRIEDLALAVRAAEQMPSARRRTAFKAIGGELDRIEEQLLVHLGIPT